MGLVVGRSVLGNHVLEPHISRVTVGNLVGMTSGRKNIIFVQGINEARVFVVLFVFGVFIVVHGPVGTRCLKFFLEAVDTFALSRGRASRGAGGRHFIFPQRLHNFQLYFFLHITGILVHHYLLLHIVHGGAGARSGLVSKRHGALL